MTPLPSSPRATALAVAIGLVAIASSPAAANSISSLDIEDAINARIKADPYFPSNTVIATCQSQQVELKGQVPNVMLKIRAERIAESVLGVVEVTNNIRIPEAEKKDDDELQEAILTSFSNDAYLSRYDLDATVQDGRATIVGNVPRRIYTDAALDLASEVDGLTDISEDINVNPRRERPRTDEVPLSQGGENNRLAKGDDAPRREPSPDGAETTQNATLPKRDPARSGDRRSAGTREPQNALQRRANEAIRSDSRLNPEPLRVSVEDQVVRVQGPVRTLAQKRVLLDALSQVDGVRDVNLSGVEIDPSGETTGSRGATPNDEQIARRVKSRLRNAARVTAKGIRVDVADRVVNLTGSIPYAGERRRAVAEARMVPGVRTVNEDLTVASDDTSRGSDKPKKQRRRSADERGTDGKTADQLADEPDAGQTVIAPGRENIPDDSNGPSDEALKSRIDKMLSKVAPNAEASVANGIVNLSGEAANAAKLVERIEDMRGVRSAVNNLDDSLAAGYAADPYVDGVGTLAILQDEFGTMEELDGGSFGGLTNGVSALTEKEIRTALENNSPGGIEFAKDGTARPADRESAVAGTTEAGIATDGVRADDRNGASTNDGRKGVDRAAADSVKRAASRDGATANGDEPTSVPKEVMDDVGPFDDVDVDDTEVGTAGAKVGEKGNDPAGQALRNKVSEALKSSPYLTGNDVSVEAVTAGRVVLGGAVTSYVEWAAARRAAYDAGAREVEMRVRVY